MYPIPRLGSIANPYTSRSRPSAAPALVMCNGMTVHSNPNNTALISTNNDNNREPTTEWIRTLNVLQLSRNTSLDKHCIVKPLVMRRRQCVIDAKTRYWISTLNDLEDDPWYYSSYQGPVVDETIENVYADDDDDDDDGPGGQGQGQRPIEDEMPKYCLWLVDVGGGRWVGVAILFDGGLVHDSMAYKRSYVRRIYVADPYPYPDDRSQKRFRNALRQKLGVLLWDHEYRIAADAWEWAELPLPPPPLSGGGAAAAYTGICVFYFLSEMLRRFSEHHHHNDAALPETTLLYRKWPTYFNADIYRMEMAGLVAAYGVGELGYRARIAVECGVDHVVPYQDAIAPGVMGMGRIMATGLRGARDADTEVAESDLELESR